MPQTNPNDDAELLDLEEESSIEELQEQVQKAQEQLLQLRRQQDSIEKQKQELEELSRRQNEFEKGKAEMCENLTRALVVLEREAYETQKRGEQIAGIRQAFTQHLETLEGIHPKSWDKANIHKDLSRSLSAVEDARTEYFKCKSKLNADSPSEIIDEEHGEDGFDGEGGHDFVYWLKSGLAFTLPLLVLGAIALVILWIRMAP